MLAALRKAVVSGEYGRRIAMDIFRRKVARHQIPVHRDNVSNKDWIILLEAGTIVGPTPDKLRVARATQERKVVKKYDIFLRATHFLVVDGYDPRIHVVYFCPQLYKYDPDKKLIPLQGDEIGRIIAHALESGINERRPWYPPSERLPDQPVIDVPSGEFESLVVEMPNARSSAAS